LKVKQEADEKAVGSEDIERY